MDQLTKHTGLGMRICEIYGPSRAYERKCQRMLDGQHILSQMDPAFDGLTIVQSHILNLALPALVL